MKNNVKTKRFEIDIKPEKITFKIKEKIWCNTFNYFLTEEQ